jgi:fucose permease
MALVSKRFSGLYAAFFAIFALFGTSMTIVGATLPKILASFQWDYRTAGLVLAAGAIGYFISTWFSGKLLAPLGVRLSVAIGLSLDAFGLALFAATPSPVANLLLYLCIGLGQGFFEVPVNWSVMRMDSLSAAESGQDSTGRALGLMHGAYAIGAVAGPFVLGWLLAAGLPWVALYRGMAAIFGLLLVAIVLLPVQILGKEEPHQPQKPRARLGAGERRSASQTKDRPPSLWKDRVYWLGFIVLFLYVGVEIGLSNWSAEYFVSVFGASAAAGSFMVSLFWLGILAGRLGFPVLARRLKQGVLLLRIAGLLAVTATLLALAGFIGPALAIPATILCLLAGLGCSSIYPVVMSLVSTAFPRTQAVAMGFAATGGGLGAFAFPYLLSLIAGTLGLRMGFLVYAGFAFITFFSCRILIQASTARSEAQKSS